jgi:hypothetical protein
VATLVLAVAVAALAPAPADAQLRTAPASGGARRSAPPPWRPTPRDSAFMDTLARRTFDWFIDVTPVQTGLTPDRWPTRTFSSIAATGFYLTALPIGVERGWITRDSARTRALNALRFHWQLPQGPQPTGVSGHQGFFYHFLDLDTGIRFQRVELSTIDTTLLLGGVLVCREYFDGTHPDEVAIRAYADSLYHRVDWAWATNGGALVRMGWHPEPRAEGNDAQGFLTATWHGYMESMLLYVLALGSPTHPVRDDAWREWAKTYRWDTFEGERFIQFAPLFGHQYSHVWLDFRGIRDDFMRRTGIDYFENSRRATISQRRYAIRNPGRWRGYGAQAWGLTAADGPVNASYVIDGRRRTFHTYMARGAGADEIRDDGTLVPTAAGGSVPFAPEITIPTLRAMRERWGDHVFNRYGFVDSFNPTLRDTTFRVTDGRIVHGVGWFDIDQLGIDQGPILAMYENWRSDLVWRLLRKNADVVRGFCRAGFRGGWLEGKCR